MRQDAKRTVGTTARKRTQRMLFTAAVATGLSAVYAGIGWGATPQRGIGWEGIAKRAHVIVRAEPGQEAAAESAVLRSGGRVERKLDVINGFSAVVPQHAVRALKGSKVVLSVTSNRSLKAQSDSYDAGTDIGSPASVAQITGAAQYWQAGYTGKGVDVAVVDSGVVPVDGLSAPGKVINGPDFSPESRNPATRYMDGFGHGTFMAGLVAGRADAAVPGTYATDATDYLGMAPDARIVSIKVADANGMTDVSQVIAAIGWVILHQHDNGMNIRVINLSYGTNSTQDYKVDPLAFAVELAWKRGIFVVAAAGNKGFTENGSLTDPAYDPTVLAVGAEDTHGTLDMSDDTPAEFSSAGTATRPVDLLAPGTHIVGLRDPGSYIDRKYGDTGRVNDQLFRGSGSSQAAAIISGAAALVLQERPSLTPDQLKALFTGTATDIKGNAQGTRGLALGTLKKAATPIAVVTGAVASTGTGSIEAARGSDHISMDGQALTGEQDVFGNAVRSGTLTALIQLASTFRGDWSGSSWSGSSWSGSSWSGSSWSGSSWSGSSWSGSSWSGSSWSGSSWSGSSWSGSSWSGSSWSGSSWSGSSWSDASWN